jgi:hypothetical protein
MECQAEFSQSGVSERRFFEHVRPPNPDEPRDPLWRPATIDDVHPRRVPRELNDREHGAIETWHYWIRNAS